MYQERPAEFMKDLATAIFRKDIVAAEATLRLMMHAGIWTDVIIAASKAVNPLPELEAPRREIFPVPGHLPGSTMHSPQVDCE